MNKSILLVDDDPQLRLALRHILAREGYHITEAADGAEALHALQEHDFDLILMDVIMPNKEGIETILEVRKLKPDLHIIAMSGGGRRHTFDPLKLARDCGARYVIAKPFEPAEIKELVRQCWAA